MSTMAQDQSVEFGRVDFYDPNRGFGQLLVERGGRTEKVFFHFSQLHYIDADNHGFPYFRNPVRLTSRVEMGDEIVFVRAETDRGPQAQPWGFAERWRKLAESVLRVPAKEAAAHIASNWGVKLVTAG